MTTDNKLWLPSLSPKIQQRINKRRQPRWRNRGKGFVKWIGFSDKTLWDIVGIIAIPVVIAIASMQFNAQQSEISSQASNRQYQTSLQIAKDQQQESAFEAYINDISNLML